MNVRTIAVLAAVSAFSAFPSPFYAGIAEASAWGLWASAVLFSAHGAAVIGAMTWLHRSDRGRDGRLLVAGALFVDSVGGLFLAAGMESASLGALLMGRLVTGLALGVATPVLTESLARHPRGTSWATAATLGGVGLGALAAAVLVATGVPVASVFVGGAIVLATAAALVALRAPATPTAALAPVPHAALGSDAGMTLAIALVFVANGVLGLFTSLIPAVVVAAVGGGALLAGLVVAATMLGAGAARLIAPAPRHRTVTLVAAGCLVGGTALFAVGILASLEAPLLLGSMVLGASCGLGYDAGLRMAIGSKVDALRRVAALARAQRAGQLGLVIPALVFPALARA